MYQPENMTFGNLEIINATLPSSSMASEVRSVRLEACFPASLQDDSSAQHSKASNKV